MKQSFRALDKTIQNKMLSHIMDDVRISAALINCFFCIKKSDSDDDEIIIEEMLKKLNKKNELEKYLKMKNINRSFQRLTENDLDDFPKFDVQLIKTYITFGWYQLSQGLGYLSEHLESNHGYEILFDRECCDENNEVKLIACLLQSRHKNRETYSVFIRYKPGTNCVEGIQAYICSCLSGHRTCGSCSHVAAIIFYLAYAKYLEEPSKKPGFMLNSFLHEDIVDSDGEDYLINEKEVNNDEKNKEAEFDTLEIDETDEICKTIISISSDVKPTEENSSSSKNKKNTRALSKSQSQSVNLSQFKHTLVKVSNSLSFREFIKRIPSNGGNVEVLIEDFYDYNCYESVEKYQKLKMVNTCTIDYMLFSIWCVTKLSENAEKKFKLFKKSECKVLQYLHKISSLIEKLQWNRVKSLWILLILKLKPENLEFSLFGTEYRFFVQYFLVFQEIYFVCHKCKKEVARSIKELLFLKDSSDRFFIHQDPKEFCAQCNQPVNGKFRLDPFYIIISANDDFYINSNSLQDIPLTINIIDKTFNLLFFTFGGNSNGIEHFRSIFYINRSFYVVDDLNKDLKRKLSSNAKLSQCVYYLAE